MIRRFLLSTVLLLITTISFGQVEVPQLSPRTTVKQTVGLTNFELDYSRPSLRGRDVFGDLLPYGKMWRTGANKNTILKFDTDITFAGKEVKAGEYAVFTKPNKETWDLFLYSETENWGVPEEWDDEKVVASLSIPVEKTDSKLETFTISFDQLGTEEFDLVFAWSDIKFDIAIELPTKELTEASIVKTMNGPSDRDYYGAANYYLSAGENLDEALTFIKKAVEIRGDDAYWYLRKQALIEYELGEKKAAISTAKRSLSSAEKAGNEGYVNMNKKSIEDWSK